MYINIYHVIHTYKNKQVKLRELDGVREKRELGDGVKGRSSSADGDSA